MLTIYQYKNPDVVRTITLQELAQHLRDGGKDGFIWVDMENPTEAEDETLLVSLFDIHPLAIEDCRRGKGEQSHLPKAEDFGRYLFTIFNPIQELPEENSRKHIQLKTTQLSAFIFSNWLITHHYQPITPIQETLQLCGRNSRALGRGPDYVFHLIIDSIVDNYNPILDHLDKAIDSLEDEVFRNPTQRSMVRILQLKKSIMTMRRTAVYQREMLSRLSRGEFGLITHEEIIYYRNVYDHLVRMSDLTESYRDMVAGVLDAYLSVTSNRLNEVMKVLTIISTIFLPLNFVSGFFGMNFDSLPLLRTGSGPIAVTMLMVAIVLGMLWYFRRRRWI